MVYRALAINQRLISSSKSLLQQGNSSVFRIWNFTLQLQFSQKNAKACCNYTANSVHRSFKNRLAGDGGNSGNYGYNFA